MLIALLGENPKVPGAILSVPLREVSITPRGKEINLEDEIGMSISIPRKAADKDEQIDLATSFSGAYKMPETVESVSPAYIIKTTEVIQFAKDVEVKFQHNANLETEEDRKDMVVLKSFREEGSASSFKEVEGEFDQHFVVMKVMSIETSIFKIGKRKKEGITKGKERLKCHTVTPLLY